MVGVAMDHPVYEKTIIEVIMVHFCMTLLAIASKLYAIANPRLDKYSLPPQTSLPCFLLG